MRKKAAVVFIALLLIFGCTTLSPPPPIKGNATIIQLPKEQAAKNATGASMTEGEETLGNGAQNEIKKEAEEPVVPQLVPRNISDKIYEGEFDLPDVSGEKLIVDVIDAGNADAILVRKGAFAMLIDDGNATLVHPYLQNENIDKLNVVVATKDRPESFSGISSALDEFLVEELWESGNAQSDEFKEMRKKAESKGIAIKHPHAGDKMRIGDMEILALNPQANDQSISPENNAIVLKIKNGEFCMVLLNPIVHEWGPRIVSAGESEGIRCDVITYFQRGEGRAEPSIAVERIGPKDVIISVGENSEGLPSPTTLAHLANQKRNAWITQANGTIRVVNSGDAGYEIYALGKS